LIGGKLGLALLMASVVGMATAQARPPASRVPGCNGPALPDGTHHLSQLPSGPLPGLDGHDHRLTDWPGKVLLVNFWAGWCGPCQYEIPDLIAFQTAHADQGLQVIGIGVDSHDRLANVARSLEIDYPVLVAGEGSGARLLADWGNPAGILPYTVVLGADGCIAHIRRGVMDEQELEDYVQPLLPPNAIERGNGVVRGPRQGTP